MPNTYWNLQVIFKPDQKQQFLGIFSLLFTPHHPIVNSQMINPFLFILNHNFHHNRVIFLYMQHSSMLSIDILKRLQAKREYTQMHFKKAYQAYEQNDTKIVELSEL